MEPLSGKIQGIAVAEAVYVWTETTILRGKKSGGGPLRWQNISEGIPPGVIIHTVVVEQGKMGSMIYAGTHRGLFWTRDEGKRWQPALGSPAGFPVEAIFTPAEGLLLIGSQEQGVLFAVYLPRKGLLDRWMDQ
jgi:hypothetical protein